MELPGLPPPPFLANITKNQTSPATAALNRISEERCFVPVSDVQVYQCTCLRCGYIWYTLQQTRPKTCPGKGCHSTYWDRAPSQAYREGKRVKKAQPEVEEKIAPRKVPKERQPKPQLSPEDEIPDIPLAVLETVDGLASATGRDAGEEAVRAEDVAVEAPADTGSVDEVGDTETRDSPTPAGQPVDDGRGQNAAVETTPQIIRNAAGENLGEVIGWEATFAQIINTGEPHVG